MPFFCHLSNDEALPRHDACSFAAPDPLSGRGMMGVGTAPADDMPELADDGGDADTSALDDEGREILRTVLERTVAAERPRFKSSFRSTQSEGLQLATSARSRMRRRLHARQSSVVCPAAGPNPPKYRCLTDVLRELTEFKGGLEYVRPRPRESWQEQQVRHGAVCGLTSVSNPCGILCRSNASAHISGAEASSLVSYCRFLCLWHTPAAVASKQCTLCATSTMAALCQCPRGVGSH